jgi:hypothetical protein
VICLDSGAGNYDQLWLTTSLRGMASGTLKVQILTEGVHSGDASAWCLRASASCGRCSTAWRTARPAACCRELPLRSAGRPLAQAKATAAILGDEVYKRFPWAHATAAAPRMFALPTTTDPVQALLNRTWKPTLSVTGAEGFPALQDAGNVLRPYTAFKLSLRLPPLVDAATAVQELKALLEDNAPYQAKVTFESRRRHRLERADHRALVRAGAERRFAGALRRALRLHRPGRHDPADEHAEPGLPEGADDGLRRARPAQQRARPERVPARAVRQEADRRRGRSDRADALSPLAPGAPCGPESRH